MENIKNLFTIKALKTTFFTACFTAGFICIGGIAMYGLSVIGSRIFDFYPGSLSDYPIQFAACVGIAGVYVAFTRVLKDRNIIS